MPKIDMAKMFKRKSFISRKIVAKRTRYRKKKSHNPVDRTKAHYRIMLLRGAKGETFNRTTIFKNDSTNKMMDVINTAINLVGVPGNAINAGIATRLVTMWIPGSKFGRDGRIQYENGSSSQVKFFDYRICVLAYDWFGTPQDANTVGNVCIVNEVLTKIYYKDA